MQQYGKNALILEAQSKNKNKGVFTFIYYN